MLQVRQITSSLFDANCYVLWDEDSKVALVVDPGPGTAGSVKELLRDSGLSLGAILLTHGHGDHVWEAAAVQEGSENIPVFVTAPDIFFMEDPAGMLGIVPEKFGMAPWNPPANVTPLEKVSLDPVPGIGIRVVPAPGHSPGSAFFLVGSPGLTQPLAFSGDVVFAGSVGRTDLVGGDEYEMRESLRTLAQVIDPATTLLPGHGPQTTWARELATNPYVVRAVQTRSGQGGSGF